MPAYPSGQHAVALARGQRPARDRHRHQRDGQHHPREDQPAGLAHVDAQQRHDRRPDDRHHAEAEPGEALVLALPLVRCEPHLESPLAAGADHLADHVHERADDQDDDREGRVAAVGERHDREAGGDPDRAAHERAGAGLDRVGAPRQPDLEERDARRVDDEQDRDHDRWGRRALGDVERQAELHDEEVHREQAGDRHHDDVGPVAQHREPRLALDPHVGRQLGQARAVPRGEAGEDGVEDEDRDVGPGLVDHQRGAAEDRAEADGGVGDRAQVGLEEHAPPARRELGDHALLHGAGGPLEERQQAQEQRELPRRTRQDGQRAGERGADHAPGEHPARAAGVAEVTCGDLDDDADDRGHRQRQRHLGGGEADLAGEVEGAGRHHRAGAEPVGEGPDGQHPQVALERDAPSGQWRSLVQRHAVLPPSLSTSRLSGETCAGHFGRLPRVGPC